MLTRSIPAGESSPLRIGLGPRCCAARLGVRQRRTQLLAICRLPTFPSRSRNCHTKRSTPVVHKAVIGPPKHLCRTGKQRLAWLLSSSRSACKPRACLWLSAQLRNLISSLRMNCCSHRDIISRSPRDTAPSHVQGAHLLRYQRHISLSHPLEQNRRHISPA